MDRRKFLIGVGTSLIAAPAIVSIYNIMPVRPYWIWASEVIFGADFEFNEYLFEGVEYHSFIDFVRAGGITLDKKISMYQLTSKGLYVQSDTLVEWDAQMKPPVKLTLVRSGL